MDRRIEILGKLGHHLQQRHLRKHLRRYYEIVYQHEIVISANNVVKLQEPKSHLQFDDRLKNQGLQRNDEALPNSSKEGA